MALDAPGFAWEFLKRNHAFVEELRFLKRVQQRRKPTRPERESFAQRWGVDFAGLSDAASAHQVTWTLAARPSTIVIDRCDAALTDPKFASEYPALSALAELQGEQILHAKGTALPVFLAGKLTGTSCVLLPLDRYFDIRARLAVRVWRVLSGRAPGSDPGALTRYRRTLLVTQLRALDGKLEGASHAQIAEFLFAKPRMSAAAWKSHDLRYRTDDAVHRGLDLMRGQYRQLLLHPYRRKIPKALLGMQDLAPV